MECVLKEYCLNEGGNIKFILIYIDAVFIQRCYYVVQMLLVIYN
jgi:hypothetical protein